MDQSISPRINKLLKRLEAVGTYLEEEHGDREWIQEELARSKKLVKEYIWAYEEGKPFFYRAMLADVSRQIDDLRRDASDEEQAVEIVDVVGRVHCRRLSLPIDFQHVYDTYSIMYRSYQCITHMSLTYPDGLIYLEPPVFIGYTVAEKPSGWSLCELREAFRAHQEAWDQSPACRSLVQLLGSAEISMPISKIVCFGLGRLDAWERTTRAELERSVMRSATQHSAALTMAEALARRQGQGQALHSYAQDPAYTDVEKELLASMGITVLDDPKGFLEVDANTLVFSVAPNVPVRQILADLQWPAAMVWNTVQPERGDEYDMEHALEVIGGREMLVSPWTTDEASSRVREMVKNYSHFPFPRTSGEDNFGDLGIYLRS